MKKIIFIFIFIFVFILLIVNPVFSDDLDPKSTFLIYLNNIYGEFTPFEAGYAASNLNIILKSKYKIQLIDNGLSSKALSLEVLKKFNLSTYAEVSGKVTSINLSNSMYKTGISLNILIDNIKTNEIDLEKNKSFEGEESYSITDSRAYTLSKAYIDIFTENIEKIIEILNK